MRRKQWEAKLLAVTLLNEYAQAQGSGQGGGQAKPRERISADSLARNMGVSL